MKVNTASIVACIFTVLVAAVSAGLPDCQVTDMAGYGNCKNNFFVNGNEKASSDVLWCKTKEDCLKVFKQPEPPPPPQAPVVITSVEEQISSSTALTTTKAIGGAFVAALLAFL
jgi:hypothetical protein